MASDRSHEMPVGTGYIAVFAKTERSHWTVCHCAAVAAGGLCRAGHGIDQVMPAVDFVHPRAFQMRLQVVDLVRVATPLLVRMKNVHRFLRQRHPVVGVAPRCTAGRDCRSGWFSPAQYTIFCLSLQWVLRKKPLRMPADCFAPCSKKTVANEAAVWYDDGNENTAATRKRPAQKKEPDYGFRYDEKRQYHEFCPPV